jgi:hypothetical protein
VNAGGNAAHRDDTLGVRAAVQEAVLAGPREWKTMAANEPGKQPTNGPSKPKAANTRSKQASAPKSKTASSTTTARSTQRAIGKRVDKQTIEPRTKSRTGTRTRTRTGRSDPAPAMKKGWPSSHRPRTSPGRRQSS